VEIRCSKIQGEIEAFLADKLNGVERQEFVDHVRGCKLCRDELEVYHVIHSVVNQLDNNTTEEDQDYIKSLEKKLNDSDNAGKKWRRTNKIITLVGVVGIGLIVAGILLLL